MHVPFSGAAPNPRAVHSRSGMRASIDVRVARDDSRIRDLDRRRLRTLEPFAVTGEGSSGLRPDFPTPRPAASAEVASAAEESGFELRGVARRGSMDPRIRGLGIVMDVWGRPLVALDPNPRRIATRGSAREASLPGAEYFRNRQTDRKSTSGGSSISPISPVDLPAHTSKEDRSDQVP